MAVDKSYGSGYKNTGMKKPVAPKAASAKLRKKGIKKAGKKYTSVTTAKAKMLPGTSDYVTQENAARKQLGVAGLAARNRQFPAAARATARGLVREFTGVDVSRKGVKVDPMGLAMALPLGKVAKAAAALRGAGKIKQAAGLEARILAKTEGRAIRGQVDDLQNLGEFGPTMKWLRRERLASERVFPKITKYSDAGMFNRYGDMLPKATRKARGIKRVNPQAE